MELKARDAEMGPRVTETTWTGMGSASRRSAAPGPRPAPPAPLAAADSALASVDLGSALLQPVWKSGNAAIRATANTRGQLIVEKREEDLDADTKRGSELE